MSRQLRCPNCGGEHTLVNPGIAMLVCHYCNTVVYWDDATALKTGNQSILPENDSRLFMHATGSLGSQTFEVVGHLRYEYGAGQWDEWYLQLGDGSEVWLSEDERELRLEQQVSLDSVPSSPGETEVGTVVVANDTTFTVRETGMATCVGGEGQLPFTLLPGEQYPYADLASLDGAQFATLEFDEEHGPTCFLGTIPSHGVLHIDDERPPSTAGAKEGRHIRCPNCDAALSVTGEREVETLVCEYCGAQNDLTGAEARVMGVNPEGYDPEFYFEIGDAGEFDGKRYEICGRMLFEDDEGYPAREYLLYNPDAGYLWLAEENGHFVVSKPTAKAPDVSPFGMFPRAKVRVGNDTYQFYEEGWSQLVYVDGALPWQASSGDTNRYADLVAPPNMFQVEKTDNEVEYFEGQWVPAEQVWQTFSGEGPCPPSYGVHPAQPFVRSGVGRMLMTMGGIFALVNLVLLGWSLGGSGKQIFRQSFQANDYVKETFSRPFAVGEGPVMSMHIDAALDNSWIALQVAMVNAKDEVVGEIEGDISYYHGYEGGESWSEGSRSSTDYFKAPKPGTYRLLLKATAGQGNVGTTPRGESLSIRLKQGAVLSRYFAVLFVVFAVMFIIGWTRKRSFEKRRWAPVMEDDDDD